MKVLFEGREQSLGGGMSRGLPWCTALAHFLPPNQKEVAVCTAFLCWGCHSKATDKVA